MRPRPRILALWQSRAPSITFRFFLVVRPAPDPSPPTHQSPCAVFQRSFVLFLSFSFSARSADFVVDWGLTEIRQAGSEDSFFGFIALFVGSLGAGHTSSPPSTTSLLRRIDRTIFIQVSLRVRRLSSPAAPNLAAAHTRPAAQPHMLRAQAMHPCFPSLPPDSLLALPPHPHARTCALLTARREPSLQSLSAFSQRAAPPWRQTTIFGSIVVCTSRTSRWCRDEFVLVASSFRGSDYGLRVWCVVARSMGRGGRVRCGRPMFLCFCVGECFVRVKIC